MKRRQFINRLMVTSGGFAFSSGLPSLLKQSSLQKEKGKLGIALVGLGSYSEGQLAPALQQTEHCYLAGIVTGTPEKEKKWSDKYNIPSSNIYNYGNFDRIADNKDIDIVYVVLPNSMHAEFTIRATQAGKHVICEKPMANNVEDCMKMINACKKAGKKLSIGYRAYFDPFHNKMMELGQHQVYGKLTNLTSAFAFYLRDPNAWRINKELAGGGPLVDLGIYCIEGSIYTAGELPVSITAKNTTKNKDFFKQVEGSIEWEMQFSSGYSSKCYASYEDQANFLKAEAVKGTFELSNAFAYNGIQGKTPEGPMNLKPVNQQALQMDDFALCVKQDKATKVPGELGLRDVYLISKIYEAAGTGKPVMLKNMPDYLYKV
ncbi:MAG TPA: Gfo/Idh/MocA family oxidoreductase [Bacteroidales bacterium]|nr:Gfo/Idh/MocA family oxidoreductase [Bacteroidales bacterium]